MDKGWDLRWGNLSGLEEHQVEYLGFCAQKIFTIFSALTLLVGCQEEHLACKTWVMRCWCGYLLGARYRLFALGPADATATPKPHHLLPHLNPEWFLPFWYQLTQVVLVKRPLSGYGSSSIKKIFINMMMQYSFLWIIILFWYTETLLIPIAYWRIILGLPYAGSSSWGCEQFTYAHLSFNQPFAAFFVSPSIIRSLYGTFWSLPL